MARLLLLGIIAAPCGHAALVAGPWSDRSLSPERRAQLLVENMTLEEKIGFLQGNPKGESICNYSQACAYIGNVASLPRLGIPPVTLQDGPQGFRDQLHPGTTTAWPSALTVAASWDEALVYKWGAAMGKEFYDKGANVALGPGLNVARVPRNGRNFEYLSGEDPFLGYTFAKSAVRGIQSQKVVANAKHWVLNNQETDRMTVSAEADERTRHEMYYPPFEGAIEAGVGSVMCSYNKIGGIYSCENPVTLKHDLKETLGFKGFVVSDWGATHSPSVMQGLDNQQPDAEWMNENLVKGMLDAGTLDPAAIDDSVRRMMWALLQVGVMDEPADTWNWTRLQRNVTSWDATLTARLLSSHATVLLKNEGNVLPMQRGGHIAVLGLADERTIVHGGGSGSVEPSFVSTPLEGIRAAVGADAKVEFHDGVDIDAAKAVAAAADVAVVFVGTLSEEGSDRASLSLNDGTDFNHQNELVEAVAKANAKTVVVASVPGAILMPWSKEVSSILVNFMPGQQAGNAVADVLFGVVNPCAKLPLTFPNEENELKLSDAQWPGTQLYAFYTEKLYTGYRYYDNFGLKFSTGFPFGHGLSYTNFTYGNLTLSKLESGAIEVSFAIQNTGGVQGQDVAQVYLGFPDDAGEPLWQLKGFKKSRMLLPGESEKMFIEIRPRDLSIWDVKSHSWVEVQGRFKVNVGASSRDTRLSADILNTYVEVSV